MRSRQKGVGSERRYIREKKGEGEREESGEKVVTTSGFKGISGNI